MDYSKAGLGIAATMAQRRDNPVVQCDLKPGRIFLVDGWKEVR
jgi:hypothetical protein